MRRWLQGRVDLKRELKSREGRLKIETSSRERNAESSFQETSFRERNERNSFERGSFEREVVSRD